MTFYRPGQDTGSSRFWLALSLSTVTAAAVAVPLGLTAVNVDSDITNAPVAPAELEGAPQAPTTSTKPLPSIEAFVPVDGGQGSISVGTVHGPAASTSSVPTVTVPDPTTTVAQPAETSTTTEPVPATSETTDAPATTAPTTVVSTSPTTSGSETPAGEEPPVGDQADADAP